MKITVEGADNDWRVSVNKDDAVLRFAESLCADEALGVLAAVLDTRYCLGWLKTPEQHERRKRKMEEVRKRNNQENEDGT